MNKRKIIQKIIGDAIKSYGFEFSGYDSETCAYKKSVGDIVQCIAIYFYSKNELKIYFSTNAYGQHPICGETLVNEGEDRGDFLGHYIYANEQEFINIIEYFKKIIFDYGFVALERISINTTEIRPTAEMNLFLYENHENLNLEYRTKLGITNDISHEEVLKKVHDYIASIKEKDFISIKNDIIGLAAIYGTLLVNVSDGYWQLGSDKKNICWIRAKNNYCESEYPLNTIIVCWRDKSDITYTILNNDYIYRKKLYDIKMK
ncbi:MAG: hypothetical protein FWC09_08380 [Lachnospiraceae bacterium]|nr:hypothetical protein [Lachnospiraceae bacterium]